ncbi:MAG: hypothetical protein WAT39_23835 [Planctomycetota bacterium]
MASPREELDALAIQARQAVQVVDALQDRLAELTDPHYSFRSHAGHLATAVFLLREAAAEVASVARVEGQRLRAGGQPCS